MHPLIRTFVGTRHDWLPPRILGLIARRNAPSEPRQQPRFRHRLGLHLVGPMAVVASCLASWPAFAGATGEDGNVALGLWVGAVSILLMAWSFILALRPRVLEPLFGGLDSMYRVHRWAGALAIAFMYLHTSIEPEIEGGIRGAAKSVADQAEDLAGTGQTMLYILVGLSIIRLVPYRFWRWTHKLLGVPFIFASWHFFTAEKPYANSSSWGWWFGGWMIAGIVTYLARVVGIDMIRRGRRYRVVRADHFDSTTELELEPVGRPLRHRLGQFAFVKLDVPGMSEPHPFTIASAPGRPNLSFTIRHLGDWSAKLPDHDLVGAPVRVEGPYGEFTPLSHIRSKRRSQVERPQPSTLWIAGGVGITPFLAAIDQLVDSTPTASTHAGSAALPKRVPPVLLYAVRQTTGNPIVTRLRDAEHQGLIDLRLFTSETGRLSPAALDELAAGRPTGERSMARELVLAATPGSGPVRCPDIAAAGRPDSMRASAPLADLTGWHVALCGPAGLVRTMADAAAGRGATTIETEDFDIRQGFGPERSQEIDELISDARTRFTARSSERAGGPPPPRGPSTT